MPGMPHGKGKENGQDYFYSCATCGQKVDMRDFRQVMWHEKPDHEPLEPEPDATVIEFTGKK